MPNSDERSQAAESLIERILMEVEDDQLQDLLVEAIDVITALHEARGWRRDELENRVSEELYVLLQARWAEDDEQTEQAEQLKRSSDS
jgi:hypothetical protein